MRVKWRRNADLSLGGRSDHAWDARFSCYCSGSSLRQEINTQGKPYQCVLT